MSYWNSHGSEGELKVPSTFLGVVTPIIGEFREDFAAIHDQSWSSQFSRPVRDSL